MTQEFLSKKNRILIVFAALIGLAVFIGYFLSMHSDVGNYVAYKDDYVEFKHPFWFESNKTSDLQVLKLNKGKTELVVWEVPAEGKSLSEYVDIVANRSFGRKNYTAKINETIKNNNGLDVYVICGDSISDSGINLQECLGITKCSYFYVIQLTAIKGDYFPEQMFKDMINSLKCL